ncbi:glycosyltransferase [Croceitalea rosinachiae]|uniref:Glycosyltransferase n=1 Tax=Croceitalea rosinachiae TaxID=3075596 RepID=A0ABU3AEA6_9FLAO|nr:glycosyltransferase [Croceitalea sp. F388]MDT0607847.1 glycosyltransferase [Croceitalea sp. F388]
MKLSVIIPLYNKEKQIERCLISLLTQDLLSSEYEIIIVDDGSTDFSNSIAQQYADGHKNIHLHCQKNAGSGAARNTGLEASKGNYVYFLDADDYVANNVFKRLIQLSELNNLEVLGFNFKYVDDVDGIIPNSTTQNIQDISVKVMDGMEFIQKYDFRAEVWWYITKRTFLTDSKLKFPHDRFVQDANFTATLILRTNRISKVNFDVYRYVKTKDSSSRTNDPKIMLKWMNDLVTAVEEYDDLVKSLDSSNLFVYNEVVKKIKRKQHAWVFAIFIKAFKCRLYFKDLKKILFKLKKLDAYPISSKYGSIGAFKAYNMILIPVFNNRILLSLALRVSKFVNFTGIVFK